MTGCRYPLPLLLASSLLVHITAQADPSPVSRAFRVQAVVVNGCSFGTEINGSSNSNLGSLSFGTVGNLSSPIDVVSNIGAGSIVLTCTPGTNVTVALDYGLNGGSSDKRYLKSDSGAGVLSYQLYKDPSYSQVWGTGALAYTVPNFPSVPQTYTVYARLFAASSLPAAGYYSDTVTVTLSF